MIEGLTIVFITIWTVITIFAPYIYIDSIGRGTELSIDATIQEWYFHKNKTDRYWWHIIKMIIFLPTLLLGYLADFIWFAITKDEK